jgi:AraC-like DNA-binding protein
MPRPRNEPPSPSSIAPAVVRYARGAGLDVGLLAMRFGLPADVEERDEVAVGPEIPSALLEWVARARGEPDLGLRLGAAMPVRRYGFAELAVRASATRRQALVLLARYAPMLHTGFEASFEEGACAGERSGEGRWILRTPRAPRGVGRQVHELALAHALSHCRAGSGARIAPTRVWFAHARPPDLEPIHAFFGTRELAFGSPENGIALGRAVLDAPMEGVDARMLATAEPLADEALKARAIAGAGAPLSGRVAARLAATLPGGTDVADVAGALHMSPRTLQRRLEEEGTRFTELLDRVRLERARLELGHPERSLTEIAFRLGFGDLATFSRAFKRWTGKPPGQWRSG